MRIPYDTKGNLQALDINKDVNDALGGKAFYLARVEMEIPVSASIKSYGLRPSVMSTPARCGGSRSRC